MLTRLFVLFALAAAFFGNSPAAENGTGAYIMAVTVLPSSLVSATVGSTVTITFVATMPRNATTTDFTPFPVATTVVSVGAEGVEGRFNAKSGRYEVTATGPGAAKVSMVTVDGKHTYATSVVNFLPDAYRQPSDVLPVVPNTPLARMGDTVSMTFTSPADFPGTPRLLIMRSDWEISTIKEFPGGLKKGDRYQIPFGVISTREPRGLKYCYVELLDETDKMIAQGAGTLSVKQSVKTFDTKLDSVSGELVVEYLGDLQPGDARVVVLADFGFYLEFRESEGQVIRQTTTALDGQIVTRLVVPKPRHSIVLPEGYYTVSLAVKTLETFAFQQATPDALYLPREVDLGR